MKAFLVIAFFTLCVPGFFLFFSVYVGLFNSVEIEERRQEETKIIGLLFGGNYQKTGKAILKVKEFLAEQNIDCIPVIIYYDDEKKVIQKFLKSLGGCIITQKPKETPNEYKMIDLPSRLSVEAVIDGHPGVSKTKAFVALREYANEKQIPINFPIIGVFTEENSRFYFLR